LPEKKRSSLEMAPSASTIGLHQSLAGMFARPATTPRKRSMLHGWTAYLLVQVAVTSTTTVNSAGETALTLLTCGVVRAVGRCEDGGSGARVGCG